MPQNLFRLLEQYRIEATSMRTQSAATKRLDHIERRQKVCADVIATIHVRKPDAMQTAELAVEPSAKLAHPSLPPSAPRNESLRRSKAKMFSHGIARGKVECWYPAAILSHSPSTSRQ